MMMSLSYLGKTHLPARAAHCLKRNKTKVLDETSTKKNKRERGGNKKISPRRKRAREKTNCTKIR